MKLSHSAAPLLLLILAGCSTFKIEDLTSITDLNPGIGSIERPSVGDVDLGKALSAGKDLADAAMLDDEQVQAMASQYSNSLDKSARIAPPSSKYSQRLKKITSGLENEDGLKLNFKVYLSPEVNAFSLADGTIRVHSGLMDKCTDDEVLAVIGHEIGHVKLGHSKARVQMAHATSGVIKGAGSMNNLAGSVASTELVGGTLEKLLNAQFSQSNEKDSDDYAVQFLQKQGKNPREMIGALNVLAKIQEETGKDTKAFRFFSTHPGPGARAERLEEEIASGDLKPADSVKQEKSSGTKPVAVEKADAKESQTDSTTVVETQEKTKISQTAEIKDEARQIASNLPIYKPRFRVLGSPKPGHHLGFYVQIVAQLNAVDSEAMVKQLNTSELRANSKKITVNGVQYTRILVGPYKTPGEAKEQLVKLTGGEFSEAAPFVQRAK